MAAFPFLSASFVLLQLALTCSAQHLNLTGPLHLASHTPGDGCVHLPIIHSTNTDHFARRGIQLALSNRSDVAYYAQLEIGTPPQTVYTQLDTGSFELWVNPDCTTVSPSDSSFCDHIGFYNTSLSSTSKSLGTSKTLRYGIGAANISYVTDTISLSGSSTFLKDIQFGVATSSKDAFSGILGIGYGQGLATKYPNFIDQLYAQKITKVKAYTLALGSKTAQQGSIVFGGVDTSKFAGPLARLPIISAEDSPDGVPRFWVQMNGISLTPPSGQSMGVYEGSKIPAFLDSGSTMTILPPALANKIAEDFGSPEMDANGFYRVGCGYVDMNGTMDFEFVGVGQKVTVRVPYKEMIREVGQGESKMCFLGIMGSESFTLLGDTFLRSAYAVFDFQTNSIWLTQATSCGNTPAALRDVTDLSRVVGNCQIQADEKEAVVDVVSETSIAPPTGSTGDTDGVTGTGGDGNGNEDGGTRTAWGFVTTTLAVPMATGLAGGGGSMSATALDSFGRSMAGDVVLSVAVAVGAAVLGSLL